MKKIASLAVVGIVFIIFSCSKTVVGPESQYPAGWPQSVAEVARIYQDSTATYPLAPVPFGSTQVGYQGEVQIDLDSQDSGRVSTLVFSACTATVKAHCTELKKIYTEIDSTLFGIRVFQTAAAVNDHGIFVSVVMIHGHFNATGVASTNLLYVGRGELITGLAPDEIMVWSSKLIIKNYAPYRSGIATSGYKILDLVTREIVDYGRY
jgi:hypothetical protein